ncbi:MAG: CPBP family intramembrane metalloprotease [Oscillospiraceae bacterium]|nr:CPBP family intramembrane metalloprotease [Oscillospiraceae bacterium]
MTKKLTVSLTKYETILGWIYLPLQLLVIPAILIFLNTLAGAPFDETQINFIFFCVNFLLLTLIFHRFLVQSANVSLAAPWKTISSALLGYAIYMAGSYFLNILIYTLEPEFFNVNDSNIAQLAEGNFPLTLFGTVILVPVAEELLFRGLLFAGFYNRSRILAYAVTIVLFSLLHVLGYIGLYEPKMLILSLLQYIPASIALAWAYARADSIWAPILLHMTVNAVGMTAMR